MIGIYIHITESQREANTGSPQKQSFCGVKSLPYITNFPPFIREGDKGGSQGNRRFFWVLKGGGLINFLPLPLDKGKGIKGIGFPKRELHGGEVGE